MLRLDRVRALLDRSAQLGNTFRVDLREVAEPLFEVGELACSTSYLHILRAVLCGARTRTTADSVRRTLYGAACAHRPDRGAVDSTYSAGHGRLSFYAQAFACT